MTVRTIETQVFQYDELDDKAKAKARDWFREGNLDYEWWDSVYEDADAVATQLGIDISTYSVPLHGGGTGNKLIILFSGFSSQGDGDCFEGTYSPCEDSPAKVRSYAPQDEELHRIADGLDELQKANKCQVTATVKHTGRYSHSNSTTIDVEGLYDSSTDADELRRLLRAFMNWIYRQLNEEYDYRNLDSTVEEDIRANEYEFTSTGERFS
jgi:hypothetical protein